MNSPSQTAKEAVPNNNRSSHSQTNTPLALFPHLLYTVLPGSCGWSTPDTFTLALPDSNGCLLK